MPVVKYKDELIGKNIVILSDDAAAARRYGDAFEGTGAQIHYINRLPENAASAQLVIKELERVDASAVLVCMPSMKPAQINGSLLLAARLDGKVPIHVKGVHAGNSVYSNRFAQTGLNYHGPTMDPMVLSHLIASDILNAGLSAAHQIHK